MKLLIALASIGFPIFGFCCEKCDKIYEEIDRNIYFLGQELYNREVNDVYYSDNDYIRGRLQVYRELRDYYFNPP